MSRNKKAGILLVILGICFPLMLLPLVTGYDAGKGVVQNLLSLSVVLKKERPFSGEGVPNSSLLRIVPTRLPYRFVLAVGILLIFVGVVKIDLSRRGNNDQGP